MWQFYVLPWVFCELPVPKFQGRKFKFRTNSVNVFPFIPSSRYFKGSKLFPQCKYWLSKPRKRNMPQFWENQLFFPQPTALYWTHCSRTNLRMPKICYQAYFYSLFCKRIKFRYLRVIFWCWHLYKPESPKVNIKFHFTLFEIWDCLNEIPLFWYFPSFSSSLHGALVTYCACLFVLILRALLQIPKPSQILMLKFKILYLGS